ERESRALAPLLIHLSNILETVIDKPDLLLFSKFELPEADLKSLAENVSLGMGPYVVRLHGPLFFGLGGHLCVPGLKRAGVPSCKCGKSIARLITNRMTAASAEIEVWSVCKAATTAKCKVKCVLPARRGGAGPVQRYTRHGPATAACVDNLSGRKFALRLQATTKDWLRVIAQRNRSRISRKRITWQQTCLR